MMDKLMKDNSSVGPDIALIKLRIQEILKVINNIIILFFIIIKKDPSQHKRAERGWEV